ncbi:hypothetical protein ACIPY2_10470 [Paenarthrobacter sp. NPDC089675]|uniref:hypothetical protein n=1 Tax=Paenarthrobacter sp. NPDC089675 TaxID=3364376 RepID=UPI00380B7F9E
MTYRELDRTGIVEDLLLEADLRGDSDLRETLLALGSYSKLQAPEPNAELAAMLAGPHDELAKRRWKHKHRAAVVGVAVVAAMGLGVSGVAAASSGHGWTSAFISDFFANLAPHKSGTPTALPTPDAPKVITEPAPGSDPAAIPSVPVPVETHDVPEGTAPAQQEAVKDSSAGDMRESAADPGNAGQPDNAAQPGNADRPGKTDPEQAKPTPPGHAKPGPVIATKPAKAEPGSRGAKQGNQGQGADKQADGSGHSVVDALKGWLLPRKNVLDPGE